MDKVFEKEIHMCMDNWICITVYLKVTKHCYSTVSQNKIKNKTKEKWEKHFIGV